MSSSNKIDFAAGVYLSDAQNPPPPLTHYINAYKILIHTGKWRRGRVEPERRGEEQQFTKLGRKYQHDWQYLQSTNSDDKHLPQSPIIGKFL